MKFEFLVEQCGIGIMSFFLERLVQLRVGTAFLVIWQRLDYETGATARNKAASEKM